MAELAAVWNQIEQLLADKISLIPVRDKQETNKNGQILPAKTPYGPWREFQNRIITKQELWQEMEKRNTTAIAMVCGKVSGNLEVIDVDTKHHPGIDAQLLTDLRTFFPLLYARLRIHQTPTKGLHIVYRVTDAVPANTKLAGRYASQQEIQTQTNNGLKRPLKEVYFLETKGEGGYFLAPPSLGYSVVQNNPIPLISTQERCSMITLCQSYSQIIKQEPMPQLPKIQADWYTVNPFEDFNNQVEPLEFMEGFNWKYSHRNNYFIWFTRPGKTAGISASWNTQKRMFFIFTSSSPLQPGKGYHPASLLAEMKFKGNKKQTYAYLVEKGFGKVKPQIEAAMVNKAAQNQALKLPPNFSDQAKENLQDKIKKLKQEYPFGPFIKYSEDARKLSVSYQAILGVAKQLGIYNYQGRAALVSNYMVEKIDDRKLQDLLKAYIHREQSQLYEEYCDVFEKFMKENTKYLISRLALLADELIEKDSKTHCRKFYRNGYLTITAQQIQFNSYDNFTGLVWKDKIQNRNYHQGQGGLFVDFLNLALVNPHTAKPILGYLAHEFKDETTGYIVVLTEACQDPKNGGGSGKNVFCNLLKLTTSYISKPALQTKFDEKFFQVWDGQKVFGVSDLPKNFDFACFKEPATGSFIHKKLFVDEKVIDTQDAPKFIMQTNYSYTDTDGGLIRRIIPLEFTNFFTNCGGIDVHFGIHFPKGWKQADYAGYDNYIAQGVQQWLQDGLKLTPTELTQEGWMKKFELNYGKTAAGFIQDRFLDLIADGKAANKTIRDLIHAYHTENRISPRYEVSYETVCKALKTYCKHKGIEVRTGHTIRVGLNFADGRLFKALNEQGAKILEQAAAGINCPF